MQMWKKMKARSKGAALVEYGLLVGLVSVLGIVGVTQMGGSVHGAFTTAETELSENTAAARGLAEGGGGTDGAAPGGPVVDPDAETDAAFSWTLHGTTRVLMPNYDGNGVFTGYSTTLALEGVFETGATLRWTVDARPEAGTAEYYNITEAPQPTVTIGANTGGETAATSNPQPGLDVSSLDELLLEITFPEDTPSYIGLEGDVLVELVPDNGGPVQAVRVEYTRGTAY